MTKEKDTTINISMPNRIVTFIAAVLLIAVCYLLIKNHNIGQQAVDQSYIELQKQRIKAEILSLRNENYQLRDERDSMSLKLQRYELIMTELQKSDSITRSDLGERTEEIKEFNIEELENYFKDEFKDL